MKFKLALSFKKVNHIHKPVFSHEDNVLKLQFLYMIQKLRTEGVRLIYLDEFAIGAEPYKNYSWGTKGKELNINVQPRQ